jgi:hypothetical protein
LVFFYFFEKEETGYALFHISADFPPLLIEIFPVFRSWMKSALKSQGKDCFNIRLRMNTDKSIMQAHNLAG